MKNLVRQSHVDLPPTILSSLGFRVFWKNGPIPASFYLCLFFSNTYLTEEKTVGFSGIRTRIVEVGGKHAEHLTTNTSPLGLKVCKLFQRLPGFIKMLICLILVKLILPIWPFKFQPSTFIFFCPEEVRSREVQGPARQDRRLLPRQRFAGVTNWSTKGKYNWLIWRHWSKQISGFYYKTNQP